MARDPIFPVRLDPTEKAVLAERADQLGMSLAEFMRMAARNFDAYTVTGKAGLPLGDRDETWDAGAAEAAMTTPDQLAMYHFYRDPDGDPETKSSYKLAFGTPEGGSHAVWAGITAVAAVLQGGRGGVSIPQDEQDQIKGKVGAYYSAAAKKYDDDTITPPWEDNGSACIDNQRALAALEEATVTDDTETLAPAPPSNGGGAPAPTGDDEATEPADTLDELADVAAQIVHCPDYGDAYWNADTGDVWWVACDGDPYPAEPGGGPDGEDVPAGTPFDEIERMFKAVDGVNTVTIEAENLPAEDAGYVPVVEEGDGGDVNPPADSDGNAPEGAAAGPLVGLQVVRDLPAEAIQSVEADGFSVASPLAVVEGPADDAEEGDSPTSDDEPTEAADIPVTDGVKFQATLAVEGVPTDDGRIIEKGGLEWRELPLTLMAIIEDSHGGMPTTVTKVCGRIDTIERVDTGEDTAQIVGTGVFDTGDVGSEVARLVTEKFLRGVSIDMAVKESDEIYGDDAEDLPEGAVEDPMFGGAFLYVVKRGIVLGATVCPFAAFGEADIEAIAASGRLSRFAMPQVSFDQDSQPTTMTLVGPLAEFEVVPADPVPPAPGGDNGQGMIAVYPQPDEASALADPDGNVPAEALHLTLIYFDQMPDSDALSQLVDDFVAGYSTVTGIVNGAAVFGGETPGAAGEPAETAPDADEGDGGGDAGADADVPQVLIIDAPGLGELRFDLADALEEAGIPYATDHDFTPHITTDYDDPADFQYDSGLIGKPVTFSALSIITGDGTRLDVPLGGGLTASAAGLVPVNPPGAWFDYPDEADGDTLEPLHVGTDGRVWGHIAAFNECHIGHPGRCVTPPHHYRAGDNGRCEVCGDPEKKADHSRSGYDLFHLGEIETAEGDLIPCGTLTLGTDHPATDSRITIAMAQRHYADTGMGAAEVVAYEDNVGIMVAGALRPDLPAAKVRELRAAKPSGDWRSNRGRREMIACLATNTPGFPVPRQSRVRNDDGEVRELGLVAAGYPDPEMAGTHAPCRDAEIDDLAARVQIPSLLARLRVRS